MSVQPGRVGKRLLVGPPILMGVGLVGNGKARWPTLPG